LFDRPILVTGFNRPDLLELVLEKLKLYNCSSVFISIDGPRVGNTSDYSRVLACREIARKFNAEDPGKNRLLETNMGCGLGIYSAIEWFFSQVEAGIIIEDDIDFGFSFLSTMDYLLSELRDDASVGSVTGLNPITALLPIDVQMRENGFIAHSFFSSWGWATWRDRWNLYEFDLSQWEIGISKFTLWRRFGILGSRFFASKFNSVRDGKVDTWDYQFLAMQIRHNLKCIAPVVNQIGNLGFRDDATHTNSESRLSLEFSPEAKLFESLKLDIETVGKIDSLYLHKHYQVPTMTQRFLSRIFPENSH
jgi:hypothetical protein